MEQSVNVRIVRTARPVCNIAGDILVIFLTWHKLYSIYQERRRLKLMGSSLVNVMLHHGAFLCLSVHHLLKFQGIGIIFFM